MQSCCLEGCESYKYTSKQIIGYFDKISAVVSEIQTFFFYNKMLLRVKNICFQRLKNLQYLKEFPFHNKSLLTKWLNEIRIPNWIPSVDQKICSTHFLVDDIDFSGNTPKLKNTAVPMIFPLKHFQNIFIEEVNPCITNNTKINDKLNSNHNLIEKKTANYDFKHIPVDSKNTSMVLLCKPNKKSSEPETKENTTKHSNSAFKKISIVNTQSKSKLNSSHQSTSLSPYILIVSESSKELNVTRNSTPARHRNATLRMYIDKRMHFSDKSIASVKNHCIEKSENGNKVNEITKHSITKRYIEEVEVDDDSSSKIVIFKFDPSIGQITVRKRDKLKKIN